MGLHWSGQAGAAGYKSDLAENTLSEDLFMDLFAKVSFLASNINWKGDRNF